MMSLDFIHLSRDSALLLEVASKKSLHRVAKEPGIPSASTMPLQTTSTIQDILIAQGEVPPRDPVVKPGSGDSSGSSGIPSGPPAVVNIPWDGDIEEYQKELEQQLVEASSPVPIAPLPAVEGAIRQTEPGVVVDRIPIVPKSGSTAPSLPADDRSAGSLVGFLEGHAASGGHPGPEVSDTEAIVMSAPAVDATITSLSTSDPIVVGEGASDPLEDD